VLLTAKVPLPVSRHITIEPKFNNLTANDWTLCEQERQVSQTNRSSTGEINFDLERCFECK